MVMRRLRQRLQNWLELALKVYAMVFPSSWIGKFQMHTRPTRHHLGSYHAGANRSDERDNDYRTESSNRSGETNFAGTTDGYALAAGQVIHWLAT